MAELRNAANQRELLVPAVIMPPSSRASPFPSLCFVTGHCTVSDVSEGTGHVCLFSVVHATVCYRTLMLVVMVVEVMLMSLRVA